MKKYVNGLVSLCKKKPFDTELIEKYIAENKMDSDSVTRAAIELCEYGLCDYDDFVFENNREPSPEELRTHRWDELFDVFIQNGLDPELVICDDGINRENIIQSLQFIDNGNIGAVILRNILNKSGSPNMVVDCNGFFEEFHVDFTWDVEMGLYSQRRLEATAFRFWLVLMGFGGAVSWREKPIDTVEGFDVADFKSFELFDYRTERDNGACKIIIFLKSTGETVATCLCE